MENREAIKLLSEIRDSEYVKYMGIKTAMFNEKAIEAFDLAISALEKQEQKRWHSVAKEGNPPKMGYYLWSARGGAVEIDFFDGEKWEKATTYLYEVLAWKYRPKAYTEEES